jgi:hypothetical protein
MISVRKRLLTAALALVSNAPLLALTHASNAYAGYGSCQLKADGLYLPGYCTQLDPAHPGQAPDFLALFGEDSRQWTVNQRRTYYDCHCQSYDEVAAAMARFGVNIENVAIALSSGPSPDSEVLNAIHADFDAAIASVGGTPFYSSPWVYPSGSILEGQRRDPVLTEVLAELTPPASTDDFTWGEDGYSRMPGLMNVGWVGELSFTLSDLNAVDQGYNPPDRSTRLSAYAATRGYPKGTVGYAVHNAIGDIYLMAGSVGQEYIGLVFNSATARALFNQPVTSPANLAMATLEYEYWVAEQQANPGSVGGNAGASFSPEKRAWLQEHVYSRGSPLRRDVPQAPPPPPGP